jgi:hypothetical protein
MIFLLKLLSIIVAIGIVFLFATFLFCCLIICEEDGEKDETSN